MYHDLKEIVAARPATNRSFWNRVDRCHCIANPGLQTVGMMQSKQDNEFETCIAKCDGNADVQKECKSNESFLDAYKDRLQGNC